MMSPKFKIVGEQGSQPSEGGIFGTRGSHGILNLSRIGSESEQSMINDPYKSK